jgi:hypothetical protein
VSQLYQLAKQLLENRDPPDGLSWEVGNHDKVIIYTLLQRLANRRLIRHWHGGFHYVASIRSCEAIRQYITTALCDLPSDAGARIVLEILRQSVQCFQTLLEQTYPKERFPYENIDAEAGISSHIVNALANLRDAFSLVVGQLARAYKIDLFDVNPSTGAFSVR